MEQHLVPRQITTFEFKLVGFMTLRQFLYLIVLLPIAYIVIRVFPIPILNYLFGALIGGFGLALAFVPVNDRPLDVFLKNLYKRITSPTQYTYQKGNDALYFLSDVRQMSDIRKTAQHVDSQQKLDSYLHGKKTADVQEEEEKILSQRKNAINSALKQPSEEKTVRETQEAPQQPTAVSTTDRSKPFVSGIVKNNKQTPLPGVLLYIKDEKNNPLRLLKTNPHGVFATYSSLPPGEYTVEIKDPKDSFFFDTMKIQLDKNNPNPLEFVSRELL